VQKSGKLWQSSFIQKGWRERLLCRSCEGRFSQWEHWFAAFWKGAPDSTLNNDPLGGGQIYARNGVEYGPFKLFHLSVLWRASVASREEFGTVSLGPYEEKLRRLLLAGDPGPDDHFPVYGAALVGLDGSAMPGLMSKPQRAKLPRETVYYAVYAGC